jgi:hypothetical protein
MVGGYLPSAGHRHQVDRLQVFLLSRGEVEADALAESQGQ